jgi:AraC-like DNA-binding protein
MARIRAATNVYSVRLKGNMESLGNVSINNYHTEVTVRGQTTVRKEEKMSERVRFYKTALRGVDAMSATTSHTFPRHTHDQYGVGVIDMGGHASRSGRGEVEAGMGSLIFVNPGEVHDGRPLGGESRSWRMLYLEPAAMLAAQTDVLEGAQTDPAFASPVFVDERLRHAFDTAFDSATRQDDGGHSMAAETATLRLVASLGINLSSKPRQPSKSTVSIRRVRDRIDADPAAPLMLSSLAREAGASRYQLLRAFAREFGLPPHAYILQQRMALARRLVRAGSALVDAAAAAGFCDQSHFTRAFVRQFGLTPARYASGTA